MKNAYFYLFVACVCMSVRACGSNVVS